MHIRAKLYPYPVLSIFNNDYLDSKFDIESEEYMDEKEIELIFKPILENKGLEKLIETDEASFVMHIESTITNFREVVYVPYDGVKIKIPANKVEGVINLCPFIVANCNIYDYSNEKFNNDYDGAKFNFDKGNILAIGCEKTIKIEKEDDDLANVPSIFSVIELKDKEQQEIIIDSSMDKIEIKLPSLVYKNFLKQNNHNPNAQPVLHSMLIIPALMQSLEEVKESYYECEERRWFRSIQKVLKEQGQELNEENVKSIKTFEIARKLMKNVTCEGIIQLNKIAYEGDNSNED